MPHGKILVKLSGIAYLNLGSRVIGHCPDNSQSEVKLLRSCNYRDLGNFATGETVLKRS